MCGCILEQIADIGHIGCRGRRAAVQSEQGLFRTGAWRPEVHMRSILLALAGLMLVAGAPAWAKIDITIDKNNQMMTVAVDGVERYHWPVSSGIPSRET